MMRRPDFRNRLHRNANGGPEHHGRHRGGRERLCPPVAKGVVLVGVATGNVKAAPYHQRANRIGGTLHGVRD